MTTDFNAERAKLRQQIQDLNKQERLETARSRRAENAAKMTPEEKKNSVEVDRLTAVVFDNDAGKEYLDKLAKSRPVVHDEIMEAMERHNAAKQAGNSN